MKFLLTTLAAAAALGALADPTATIQSVTRNASSGAISVCYTLADEDAIVTLAADVYRDSAWQRLPPRAVRNVAGDANRLVTAGTAVRTVVWQPSLDSADMAGTGRVRVRLTLWSPAQPPDYMSVRINDNKDVRYYVDAEALPYPATHANWKLFEMLFRKIPAQGVKWRMSSVSADRIVRINHDYYFAIYPYLRGQQRNVWYDMDWGYPRFFADPARMHESPCPPFAYGEIRGTDTGVADYPPTDSSFLSSRLNLSIAISCDLPTEAEWEYACRAGTWTSLYTGKDNSEENVDEVAWYSGNSNDQLHPVGEKVPNAWGLYEMYGNVHEWCRDFYAEATDPYFATTSFAAPADDPVGPAENRVMTSGTYTRVLRGGSHNTGAGAIHSGFRWGYASNYGGTDKAFCFRLSHTITGKPFANPTDRYADLDTSVADGNWDCTGHSQPGLIVVTAELEDVDLRGTVATSSPGIDFDSAWFATAYSEKCKWNGGLMLFVR